MEGQPQYGGGQRISQRALGKGKRKGEQRGRRGLIGVTPRHHSPPKRMQVLTEKRSRNEMSACSWAKGVVENDQGGSLCTVPSDKGFSHPVII